MHKFREINTNEIKGLIEIFESKYIKIDKNLLSNVNKSRLNDTTDNRPAVSTKVSVSNSSRPAPYTITKRVESRTATPENQIQRSFAFKNNTGRPTSSVNSQPLNANAINNANLSSNPVICLSSTLNSSSLSANNQNVNNSSQKTCKIDISEGLILIFLGGYRKLKRIILKYINSNYNIILEVLSQLIFGVDDE